MKLGPSAGTQRGEGRPEEEKNPELQTLGRSQRGGGAGGGGQEGEAPGGPQQELSLFGWKGKANVQCRRSTF